MRGGEARSVRTAGGGPEGGGEGDRELTEAAEGAEAEAAEGAETETAEKRIHNGEAGERRTNGDGRNQIRRAQIASRAAAGFPFRLR